MSVGGFFRRLGLWMFQILLILSIVLAVLLGGAAHMTNPSFLKPIAGQLMASQISASDNASIDQYIDSSYEKKVCSGYGCLQMLKNLQSPTDIISRDFNDFLKSQAFILAGLAVMFGILVLLLARGWPAKLMSFGTSLFMSGIPYVVLIFLKGYAASMFPSDMGNLKPLMDMIINPIARVFLWLLISGIVVLASGIGLRMYLKKGKSEKK